MPEPCMPEPRHPVLRDERVEGHSSLFPGFLAPPFMSLIRQDFHV